MNNEIKTLLYTIEGEIIKVIIEKIQSSSDIYRVIVKGFETINKIPESVKYNEPSFIFSEPCFLNNINGSILTEYRLITNDLKNKTTILNLSMMQNMTILDNFANNQGFKQIHIPKNLKIINKSNFLESVEIISNSARITQIGDDAFNSEFRQKNEITFSDYNGSYFISLGKNAFKKTKLNLNVQDSKATMNRLTQVEESAFEQTTGLNELEAKNLETIQIKTFYKSGFSDLTLSKAIYFENEAFTGMNLKTITLGNIYKNNGYYIGPYVLENENLNDFIIYVPTKESRNYLLEQIKLGNPMFTDRYGRSITEKNLVIGAWYNTTGHTVEETIEAIESNSYTGLIDRIYLDGSKYEDVINAFINPKYTSIKEINFTGNSLDNRIINKILNIKGAILKNYPNGIILDGLNKNPSLGYLNIEKLNITSTDNTFKIQNITSLTSLTLPSNLKTISDNYGFINLGISSLNIPTTITYIGSSGFANNKFLTNVSLNSNINILSEKLFYNCPKLELTIPSYVTELRKDFMYGNTTMKSMNINSNIKTLQQNTFNNMSLVNLTFEEFNTINFSGPILSNCSNLKTIYINTSGDIKMFNSSIFNQRCNIYVDTYKNYELLIENSFYDQKPIYISGDWFDTESGLDSDFDNMKKLKDVKSIIYNSDNSITNYKGDELYLINPDILEFNNINRLTSLTKLTIDNQSSQKILDLDMLILPSSLKHLDISSNISNVNLTNLTNLTCLCLNNSQNYEKSLNKIGSLKILKIGSNCQFSEYSEGDIFNFEPLELVIVSNTTRPNNFRNIIPISECNFKINYYNTFRRNYEEIYEQSNQTNQFKFFDLERRINNNLKINGIIISNIQNINPLSNLGNLIELTDLYMFNCNYFDDYNFDTPRITNVYLYNITQHNYKKYKFNDNGMKSTIKYFRFDKNMDYTLTSESAQNPASINMLTFNNPIQRDTVIFSNNQTNLYHLITNSNIQNIIFGDALSILYMIDLRINYEYKKNRLDLKNIKVINGGLYSQFIKKRVEQENLTTEIPKTNDICLIGNELNILDYSFGHYSEKDIPFPYESTTVARFDELIVPKLSNLSYTLVSRTVNRGQFFLELGWLKHLEVGDLYDYNLIDDARNNVPCAMTTVENLEIVRFGPAIKTFGDETLTGATNLQEIYLDSDEINIASPSKNVNENVKVYVSEINIYEKLVEHPESFIEELKPENVIFVSKLFDTSEHDDLDSLLNVCLTGTDGSENYNGIDDKAQNLYKIDLPSELSTRIKTLYLYSINQIEFKQLLLDLNLSLVKNIKIIGEDIELYHIGLNPNYTEYNSTRGSEIISVDLSEAYFKDNTITDFAFNECTKLNNVILNNSVEIIGEKAFNECPLTTIKLEDSAEKTESIYYTVNSKSDDEIITMFTSPYIETYKTFDDSTGLTNSGKLCQLIPSKISDLSLMSSQFSELRICIDDTHSNILKYIPETIRTLKISGSITKLPIFNDSNLYKNISNVIIDTNGEFTILSDTFKNNTKLKQISGTITSIESNAFNGSGLNIVNLSVVKNIGDGAFNNCKRLIKASLTGLTNKTNAIFEYCDKLISVELGSAIISSTMFKNCSNIQTVITNTTQIEDSAFKNTNLNVIQADNLITCGNQSFYNTKIKQFKSKNVISLGDSCFENCENLTDINCESCKTIGNSCFKNCEQLKSVILNTNSDRIIGEYAFYNNKSLIEFDVNRIQEIKSFTFENCESLELVKNINWNELNLDSEEIYLKIINSKAFKNCSKLQFSSVESDKNNYNLSYVSEIGYEAFMNTPVKNFTASKVSKIDKNVFNGCSTIDNQISINLSGLKEFLDNSNNQDIVGYFEGLHINELIFGDLELTTNIFDKIVSIQSLKTETLSQITSNNLPNIISKCIGIKTFIANNLTSIPSTTFTNNKTIEHVECELIEQIGDNSYNGAFENCTNLIDIKMSNVKRILESSFKNCTSLTRIDISNCDKISNNAFESCTNLINVIMTVKYIGNSAFKDCSSLQNVVLNGDIEMIGESAFENCSKLHTFNINGTFQTHDPNDITKKIDTEIKNNTFKNCYNLRNINGLDNVIKYGNSAFLNAGITTITLSSNNVTIGNETFKGSKIKTISNCRSIISIGTGAFQNAINLINFTANSLLMELPTYAFENCSSLEEIYLSGCTKNNCSFIGCSKLKNILFAILDFRSNIYAYDKYTGNITTLRGFAVPTSISTTSKYSGTIYYTIATNLEQAKKIAPYATFTQR